MFKKMDKMVAIAMMLFLVGSGSVFAAEPNVVVTGAENVTISDFSAANFGSVTLDGTTKTTTSTVTDMTLIDARGTGDGWSVNLTATQFTNATADNVALNTLSNSSLVLGTVSIEASADSTPVENITIGSGAIDKVGGVKILNASVNEGMGIYTVGITPMTLTLLPKEAKAGTYVSTITMTLSQGPTI